MNMTFAKKRRSYMKRKIAVLLTLMMLLTQLPMAAILSFADPNAIILNRVEYEQNYSDFEVLKNGILTLFGQNIRNAEVLFDVQDVGWTLYGTRNNLAQSAISFTLTAQQAARFRGRILVNGQILDITGNAATINGVTNDKRTVNIDNYSQPGGDSITFTGTNLNLVGTPGVNIRYFVESANIKSFPVDPSATSTRYTLTNPEYFSLGKQNVRIENDKTVTFAGNPVEVSSRFSYDNAFNIYRNTVTQNIEMYPNTGAKGEEFYFRGNIPGQASDYAIYFLKALDGSDTFSTLNQATNIVLGKEFDENNTPTGLDLLSAKVPQGAGFLAGDYKVVLVDRVGNQVVAETFISDYKVIDTIYKPRITNIEPKRGSDQGSNTTITGDFIVDLYLPNLNYTGPTPTNAGKPISDSGFNTPQLTLQYGNTYTYNGVPVTSIERKLDVIIGGTAEFRSRSANQITVRTSGAGDAETDPFKDVIITMTTLIRTNDGRLYTIRQNATLPNGYEYVPSTYTPSITGITPNVIQIKNAPILGSTNLNELETEVFIGIKGQRFFVERSTDPVTGQLVLRYPSILIKTNPLDETDDYELGFFPNENGGTIRYFNGTNHVTLDANFQITVLNANGFIVDGTTGNEIGTKILLRIPEEALITLGASVERGLKRIQVINPRRNTTEYGNSSLTDEILEVVRTTDIPRIQTVTPSVVTTEGGELITIRGTNLQNGMRLFLDGEEITTFTRTLDLSAGGMVVTFRAPAGREGTTQIAIINPSGGIATSFFTYVRAFQQDPVFTSFAPPQGTAGTLVVINGKNFVKPDPSTPTEDGIDAYRLVGTRIFIDGRDVNSYNLNKNVIQFISYTVPNAQAILGATGGTPSKKPAEFSPFAANAQAFHVASPTSRILGKLTNDAQNNPAIDIGTEIYSFRYQSGSGTYDVYNSNGSRVDTATINHNTTSPQKITTVITFTDSTKRDENDQVIVTPVIIEVVMDNNLVRIVMGEDGKNKVVLSDYAQSVILQNPQERMTLDYNFKTEVVLSNGREKEYILYAENGNIRGRDAQGNIVTVVPTQDGLTVDGTLYTMKTAYVVDSDNGRITGHNSKVFTTEQMFFNVPTLTSGRGYKDLVVVNPDTKSASKLGNNGFFYIPQASSFPVITDIQPQKGSVDGGYYVTITGSDFADDARIYVDAVAVPIADTLVSLDGRSIRIKMPATLKKLNEDFGVDSLAVPVVVVNGDGGSAFREKGFTYIIPKSAPFITQIIPTGGSSNGGEIVEIFGTEFRFYEPYENSEGKNFPEGDNYTDLNFNGKWDHLTQTTPGVPVKTPDEWWALGVINRHVEFTNPFHNYYYTSPILPTVFFGDKEANIVEYGNGYIKVITPPQKAGVVDVYVINNDSGVSNKVKYTYTTTTPVITSLVPAFGKRQGQEPKDLYGSKMFPSRIQGYMNDDADIIQVLPHMQAIVRFGNIDNRSINRVQPNSGLINNQRTSVKLDGGLEVTYLGDQNKIRVTLLENNVLYEREFAYNDDIVYVPLGMLKEKDGTNYYVPFGIKGVDPSVYSGQAYEHIRLEIAERRLFVERGYAPRVTYNNENHVVVYTPTYYTIGLVPMTFFNTDGGKATRNFTYTNPDSEPKIFKVEPQEISFEKDRWLVNSSMEGGIDIEIIGQDFRKNASVYIGSYKATVKELTTKEVGGVTYDLIVANVPKANLADVDLELPVMVLNEDQGLASSSNIPDLIGPNYEDKTLPIYFVYKKPLSAPRIDSITPQRTSVAGGNTITIVGSDFRAGAYVIIGTRAGIPIYDSIITERGTNITFKTPQNMTLGAKTVQVLNNDYGIGIRENGIIVVSAPTIDPVVRDLDGSPINRIHVTGNQEVLIKGTGFQEGARVYFGGEYLVAKAGDAVPDTEKGIYRDDSVRYVKQGILAKKVEFIDSETLKVTTPEVTFEGDVTIVVRNPDWGITDGDTKLEYTVPIPKDPTGLKVEVVDDRYLKIYDYVSDTADYFEIYVYIGIKTDSELLVNGYRDFQYLGITNIEPYKITELPGLERMKTAERIVFVVKAVNKFGPSGYSNLAWLTYENIKNIDELGPEDVDGGLGVPKGQDFTSNVNGGVLQINLAGSLDKASLTIDVTDVVQRNTEVKQIVLPESLVNTSRTSITVNTGTTVYRFTPITLNTLNYRTVANQYDAYARITEDTRMNAQRSYLTPNIRGKVQVSKVHSISFDATSNQRTLAFDTLSGTLDMVIPFDGANMTLAQKLQIQLYRYNPTTAAYEVVAATVDSNTNRVTARITQSGHYVLMTNR